MVFAILGGGFAGLAAARELDKRLPKKPSYEIVLIDRHSYTTMLPSLPDVAGRRVEPDRVKEAITSQLPKRVRFIKEAVEYVDFSTRTIQMGDTELVYDQLIFAPGSRANFYNHSAQFQKNLKLDNLDDAIMIRDSFARALFNVEHLNVVISGGGFTGMEVASNLYRYAGFLERSCSIYVVDRNRTILPALGDKRSNYIMEQMSRLGFQFILDTEVSDYADQTVVLNTGEKIHDAFFVWCSGVKLAIPARGHQQQIRDDRIIVDSFLRIPEHPEVFVAGDAAAVKAGDTYLRRAVNFAAMSGKIAARNAVAALQGKNLKRFKPIDLGWVIPLYTTSVGEAFGMKTQGRIGIPLHYLMCGIKNYNAKNISSYAGYAIKFSFARPFRKYTGD
ncbi:MAG: FAD-dependent oxidoreductase [Eubacteriales bacterium]|nr:FAD-dependent oxidoreductase [Eubacteriales bacterium]